MSNQTFDLIIRNATIIDGSGTGKFSGDLGVRDGLIAAIGDLRQDQADTVLDGSGKVAAPGFIDVHTHDDRLLLSSPDMTPKLSQGVTTVIVGNCGISLAPLKMSSANPSMTAPLDLLGEHEWYRFPSFAAYFEELDGAAPAINAATLVGHTTLRITVMDKLERAATPAEIGKMQSLALEGIESGAVGISTGTFYPPAAAAPTDELIAVCRPLTEVGGVYVTHMRDEAEDIIGSMDETFHIGRALKSPVVISHHKVIGAENFGRSRETLAHIDKHKHDQAIGLDCYPYHASSTVLSTKRMGAASRILVTWSKPHPEFAGMDLAVVAAKLGLSQEATVEKLKPGGAIYFTMDEPDVQRILAFDETMIGSDGLPHDAMPHPRLWGTFPRVLGHYCRDLKLFPLEKAVYKMTGLSAKNFRLARRGLLRQGYHADITLFDPQTILDVATFDKPMQTSRGIDTVIVNGTIAWREGKATGSRTGRMIRRMDT